MKIWIQSLSRISAAEKYLNQYPDEGGITYIGRTACLSNEIKRLIKITETEYCQINCKCGNTISYNDMYTPGFKDNDVVIIKCNQCNKEYKMVVKGIIIDLEKGKVT